MQEQDMGDTPSQEEIDAVAHFVEATRELGASPFFIEEHRTLSISVRGGGALGQKGACIMNRSSEFIAACNRVKAALADRLGASRQERYSRLIEAAACRDAIINNHLYALKDYGDLRNAIVHAKGFPQEVIAEISEKALAEFMQLADYITNPPLVGNVYCKKVRVFSCAEELSSVLEHMNANDFSQVVVRDSRGTLGVLTVEGVNRWMCHHMHGGHVDLNNVRVADAMPHEPRGSFQIIHVNATVGEAEMAMSRVSEEQQGSRVYCLVITIDGRGGADPMGIIAPWDILRRGGRPVVAIAGEVDIERTGMGT